MIYSVGLRTTDTAINHAMVEIYTPATLAINLHSALFSERFEIVFPFGVPIVVSSLIGRAMGLC
jgi:hypothetical protein